MKLSHVKVLLGFLISIVFLYYVFSKVKYEYFILSLKNTNLYLVLLSIPIVFVGESFRALRWYYILLPHKLVKKQKLYSQIIVANMLNYIYPLRAGEIYRALSISREEEIKKSTSLAIVLLERILDNLILISFFLSSLSLNLALSIQRR